MHNLIKVTFPDNEEICYKSPVHTVMAVLRKIGIERFPEITMQIRNHPLVSQEIFPKLEKYTKEIVPGWYYIAQSDTREKTSQLININKTLGLGLKIEEVSDCVGTPNPKVEGATKIKSRMIVTFPNGEEVAGNGYRDVFMACINKLGPQRVKQKANLDLSKNRPLITATNIDGTRHKIGDSIYLGLPYTAKEAKKVLDIIGKRLREEFVTTLLPYKNTASECAVQ